MSKVEERLGQSLGGKKLIAIMYRAPGNYIKAWTETIKTWPDSIDILPNSIMEISQKYDPVLSKLFPILTRWSKPAVYILDIESDEIRLIEYGDIWKFYMEVDLLKFQYSSQFQKYNVCDLAKTPDRKRMTSSFFRRIELRGTNQVV